MSPRIYRIALGGLLIHLGEPPRVTRKSRPYDRDADAEERALAREHGVHLDGR